MLDFLIVHFHTKIFGVIITKAVPCDTFVYKKMNNVHKKDKIGCGLKYLETIIQSLKINKVL